MKIQLHREKKSVKEEKSQGDTLFALSKENFHSTLLAKLNLPFEVRSTGFERWNSF